MSSHITGPLGASGPSLHGLGRSDAAEQKGLRGEWNGISVSAEKSPSSLLADAMEEMTFSASEEVEKDVTERKKTDKKDGFDRLKVHPPKETMEKLKKRLMDRMGKLRDALAASGGNPALFRQSLNALFPDPTERHAALLLLSEDLGDEASLGVMVKREIDALETAETQAIQAGYNISDVDADGVGEPAEAFDLYRQTVFGDNDIAAVLEMVLEKSADGDFLDTVDFLARSVGADLSAATPSCDKNDLEAMNSDLFNLRALANFTREFDGVLGNLRDRHNLPPLPNAGREVLGLLLKSKNARILLLEPLNAILNTQKSANPTYDVQALTKTHALAHKMPVRLFADVDSRQRLLDGVQKLLDTAVDLEESLLAEEE